MTSAEKTYEAVVGLDYRHVETGEETRVEAGDKIEGMSHDAIRHELQAGNIKLSEVKSSSRKSKGVTGSVNSSD